MIVLYTFGPAFGLPDASPFVTKVEILLKLAGLEYRTDTKGFNKAPKGKLPFISDNGVKVADSTLIRMYFESKYGIDFNAGLSPQEQGVAWAMEKLCEDHLYWIMLQTRWLDHANYEKGPKRYFDAIPQPLRAIISAKVVREMRRNLHGQGMGRMSAKEQRALSTKSADALSAQLGDKPWLMGSAPTAADATVWPFVIGALCPMFEGPPREAFEQHPNLAAYRDRGMDQWFAGELS